MSASVDPATDDYALGRDIFAGLRLNLQHFLWRKYFKYLLHPSLPREGILAVADVGTGTGVWLIDVADELPNAVELHGFDIDITQTPPLGFLPANVKMTKLDIFKPIPDEYHGKFDIVNLRLFMLVVKDNDPMPVVQNLVKMLRPGGWIQWSEADLITIEFRLASPGLSTQAMTELRSKTLPTDSRFIPGSWIPTLGSYFEKEGLINVTCDKIEGTDMPLVWQSFTQEATLAVYVEIIAKMPHGELRSDLARLLEQAADESRKGATWTAPRLTWIGRKPQ